MNGCLWRALGGRWWCDCIVCLPLDEFFAFAGGKPEKSPHNSSKLPAATRTGFMCVR